MDKMQFENGVLVTPAKVTINGVDHEVTPAVYEGNTPFSAENVNKMQDNIERAIAVGGVAGDTLPIGSIVPFGSFTVPENWILCDGRAVSRTEYDLLFAVIGTTWGAGDGSTTFNVPNLQGRVPVGWKSNDADFGYLGGTGGEKTHELTVDEMPSHNHGFRAVKDHINTDSEGNEGLAKSNNAQGNNSGLGDFGTTAIENTGGSQPHNNLQPYVTSNFIIKAKQSAGVVANVVDSLESNSDKDALSAKQGKVLNEKIANVVSKSISGSEMCTKFSDGTMIVTGTSDAVRFTGAGNQAKTIDISKYGFKALVSASATNEVTYADEHYCDFVVYVYSKSKDEVRFQVWNKYPSDIGFFINYIIVGIWK